LVTVAAGSFDAFVIEREIVSRSRVYSFHEVVSYWYAPEVGYVVKIAHNLQNGMYSYAADDEAVRVVGN